MLGHPPFVSNLAAAFDGSSYSSRLLAPSGEPTAILSSWKSTSSAGQAVRLPVQQIALRAFTTHIVKNTWIDLIRKRMKTLDPNVAFVPVPACVENVFVPFQMQQILCYVSGQNLIQ